MHMTPQITQLPLTLLTSLVLALSGCATGPNSQVLSPAPKYVGTSIDKLYVYSFLDVRPEFINDRFAEKVRQMMQEELKKCAVSTEQVWFGETPQSKLLHANPERYTLASSKLISVEGTIADNRVAEQSFEPSHRLVVFPQSTSGTPNNFTFELKWDLIETRTRYVQWSVYTRTSSLSKNMTPERADAAANGFVGSILSEMKGKDVIRCPRT